MIIAANRPPVTYGRDTEGALVARRGAGGLVSALRGLLRDSDVTWVASAISEADRTLARAEPQGRVESIGDGSARVRLLSHDTAAYAQFYEHVANPALWFTQHQLWNLPYEPSFGEDFAASWHNGYRVVNDAFAAAVAEEICSRPHEPAVIHDYHLYLAPRGVRERVPQACLAQFVHIPWPPPDAFRVLPLALARAALDGLLASDLVGFHTARWRDNFAACCVELLGARKLGNDGVRYAGRETRLTVRPISVSPTHLGALAQDAAVMKEEQAIRDGRPEFLVVRVDRTDPSKNIVRGFAAFDLLLERHSELHERVELLALVDPSRQSIPAYDAYRTAIERAAERVNARFGTASWTPVRLEAEDNFPRAVAAYKQYDVLFVNPVFDGLNLVAKEGPLVNTQDGVVVLSDNAGAHDELADLVLSVNPFDLSQQADALFEAITMPLNEKQGRASDLRSLIEEKPVEVWADGLLDDLAEAVAPSGRTIHR